MVEEKVAEVVAVGVHARLLAEAGRPEEGKRLEGPQCGLALCHCYRAAGDWNEMEKIGDFFCETSGGRNWKVMR
jgi:hypothetical protein